MTDQSKAARALVELRDELANFADYSRAVAVDAAGQVRLNWQERAAWAQRLAATASDALDEQEGGTNG